VPSFALMTVLALFAFPYLIQLPQQLTSPFARESLPHHQRARATASSALETVVSPLLWRQPCPEPRDTLIFLRDRESLNNSALSLQPQPSQAESALTLLLLAKRNNVFVSHSLEIYFVRCLAKAADGSPRQPN